MDDIQALVIREPGIKARRIAALLELDRKKVNRFLHGSELFVQDEKSGWSLAADSPELVITMPSGWITPELFERTLSRSVFDKNTVKRLVISLVPGSKLLMSATARLLSFTNQLADIGVEVSLDLGQVPEVKSYLNRAGFFDVLHEKVRVLPRRPKQSTAQSFQGGASTLVEFRRLAPGVRVDEVPSLLFKSITNFSGVENWAIYTFLSELYNNVYEHVFEYGGCQLHGFAACQAYSRRSGVHVQVVISDCGQGICNTLRPAISRRPDLQRYKSLDDVGLITAAFMDGKITRYDPNTDPDHGLGLKRSGAQAEILNAKILIRQEGFSLELGWKEGVLGVIKSQRDLIPILGTNICFDFFVD